VEVVGEEGDGVGVGRCVAGAGAVVSDEVPATTIAAATAAELAAIPATKIFMPLRVEPGLPFLAGFCGFCGVSEGRAWAPSAVAATGTVREGRARQAAR
ncbi:hypothetical protein, partial [Streptomyces europaeiscabiei]|uniref:hypothetical protein n=1 Tax=Streptomyces europaeiscabiei TaxID=146819 RepID=UPI0029C0F1D3